MDIDINGDIINHKSKNLYTIITVDVVSKKKHVRSIDIGHNLLRIPEVDDARCSSHLWAYAHTSGIRKLPKLESSYTYTHA